METNKVYRFNLLTPSKHLIKLYDLCNSFKNTLINSNAVYHSLHIIYNKIFLILLKISWFLLMFNDHENINLMCVNASC